MYTYRINISVIIRLVITGNERIDDALDKGKDKLFAVMSIYEEAIGLKEIREAQHNVLQVSVTLKF